MGAWAGHATILAFCWHSPSTQWMGEGRSSDCETVRLPRSSILDSSLPHLRPLTSGHSFLSCPRLPSLLSY